MEGFVERGVGAEPEDACKVLMSTGGAGGCVVWRRTCSYGRE